MSVLSTALPTLLTAQEARASLTVFLDRLDPDSLPTEEAKLLYPGMLLPSSSSTAVVSSFLMLWPVHTVPCIMLIPNHKVILLPLHNCTFATVLYLSVISDV